MSNSLPRKERAALLRKHVRGHQKRAVITMLERARIQLVYARETLHIIDERVLQREQVSVLTLQEQTLETLLNQLATLSNEIDRLGLDYVRVLAVHEHEYAHDHPDEGCSHCGIKRDSR